MLTKTTPFDAARHLTTPEAQAEYLSAMMVDNNPDLIRHALATVARARGMADLAKAAGLGSKSLYKTLGEEGNPEFGTVLRVLGAMGLSLAVRPTSVGAETYQRPGDDEVIGAAPITEEPVLASTDEEVPPPATARPRKARTAARGLQSG